MPIRERERGRDRDSGDRDSRDRDRDRDGGRGRSKTGETVGRRSRHLQGVDEIDYRDVNLLRRFVTQQGKVMPARFTGASAKQQREISRAIKRAREMGLLP